MCVRVAFAFLVFVEVCTAIIVESTIAPFYDQSFCCELLYHLRKKLFPQLIFEMAVFFTAPRSVVY